MAQNPYKLFTPYRVIGVSELWIREASEERICDDDRRMLSAVSVSGLWSLVSRIQASEEGCGKDGVFMSWSYRIRKRFIDGEPWYDIVEYIDIGKHPKGWSESSITPGSETRKGLVWVLENMLKDAKHYRTVVDKEEPHGKSH
jgi:hypothetical protein